MPLAPRVSVVIASYNHAVYVADCIHSVLGQSFQDFEIVVTDDGSVDGTSRVVGAIGDPRIHLHAFPANLGACAAMNHAISRSRGEFIAVLNSDDLFLPGKLARQVAFLDQHPAVGAVFGLPRLVGEQGQPFVDPTHKDSAVFRVPNRARHDWLRHFFDEGNVLCHPTAMVRRSVYDEVGLYDTRLAQVPDLDMWIRITLRHDIHVMQEELTAFRIRDQQRNASAARPEVVVRDAWERAKVLRHYLGMSRDELARVFPEELPGQKSRPFLPPGADDQQAVATCLARRALALRYPFYLRFALDALFDVLPADAGSLAVREFIDLTGEHDLHRLHPR